MKNSGATGTGSACQWLACEVVAITGDEAMKFPTPHRRVLFLLIALYAPLLVYDLAATVEAIFGI